MQEVEGRSRVGFATEIRPEQIKRIGLNEAITHHITQGIINGDFETIDPDKRSGDDHVYYSYRKVLTDFVNKSQGLIDVKTLTNGYYEDTEPDGDREACKRLVAGIVSAYGHGGR